MNTDKTQTFMQGKGKHTHRKIRGYLANGRQVIPRPDKALPAPIDSHAAALVRIVTLGKERDHYKAHADKLAEALREIANVAFRERNNDISMPEGTFNKAKAALAAYEEARGK